MARDFWFQALESQAVTSLRFVHCRPPDSSRFDHRRGDILETGSLDWIGPPKVSDWPQVSTSGVSLLRSPRRSPPNGNEILDFLLVELLRRLFQ